jgi:NADH dehydrogenase/NADH:ubiquinone oxidoreductase subunit G
VGALTLKSFPFELKGWDVEEHEGLDPTDSFGSNIRVYVNQDQVIQIESDYDDQIPYAWITDKGRQFFDGAFVNEESDLSFDKNAWLKLVKNLKQNLYIYYLCNHQILSYQFFTIVFQNINLEILSLLNSISNSYSFIKIRKAENVKVNNDLESSFQLNVLSSKININNSNI